MPIPQIKAPLAGPQLTPLPIPTPDYANGQRIAVGASHAESTAIAGDVVELRPSCDCFIKAGVTPVATVGAGSLPLFAGESKFIGITPGDKISVIRTSVDGFLTIMPVVQVS